MKNILWENTNGKEARFQGTGGCKAPFCDANKMTAGLNGLGIYFTNLSLVTTQSHIYSGKIPSSDWPGWGTHVEPSNSDFAQLVLYK